MASVSPTPVAASVRPPVVVVLGHVDHGKTKLLDTIRHTNVVDKESGGITQHIGAYQATVNDKVITFLDTPGHEAFAAIRARGTRVADIAILVVAADESVKPQTKEAIRIIKQEQVPMIVAINKVDKEGANIPRVKQDLAAEEIFVEGWGGTVPVAEISAKTGAGIPELLELIVLVAELADLKQDITEPARGVIIESHLDRRRGMVATALVQHGTIHQGDWIVVGTVVGKIKSMEDFLGATISEAYPSQPVRILGWEKAPDIGKGFVVSATKDAAHAAASHNVDIAPLLRFFHDSTTEVDPTKKILNIIFKSDVASSMEAIEAALGAISSDEVALRVLDYGIGNVTEADIKTAASSQALVVGFRVGIEPSAKRLAEKDHITIETFDIIYELLERVRQELGASLAPTINRIVLAKLRVLALFKKDARSQVVGCRVVTGKVTRGALVDLIRNKEAIKLGKLTQLQHNKEDVTEVREGLDAGLRIEFPTVEYAITEGDTLEVYQEEEVQRTL